MRTPDPLPGPFAWRPFLVRDAVATGVPATRLRRQDLGAPFHGMRASSDDAALIDPASLIDDEHRWQRLREIAVARAHALAPRLTETTAFSHLTAARLHGLPIPPRLAKDLTVDVSVTDASARPQLRGVRSHLVPAGRQSVVLLGGLLVISPIDTWCAMSTMLHTRELVVMGDGLVRRSNPIASPAQLAQAVDGYRGRNGVRRLRSALALVRPRTDSPTESELRLALVDAGLPEPEINGWVRDAQGNRIRPGDMLYRMWRILIEYDGPHHFDDRRQFHKDIDALDRAMAAGWRVIRVHQQHRAARFATTVARVRAALLERGWHPYPSGPSDSAGNTPFRPTG